MVLTILGKNRSHEFLKNAIKTTKELRNLQNMPNFAKRDTLDLPKLYENIEQIASYRKGFIKDNPALLVKLPTDYRKSALKAIMNHCKIFEKRHFTLMNAYENAKFFNSLPEKAVNELLENVFHKNYTSLDDNGKNKIEPIIIEILNKNEIKNTEISTKIFDGFKNIKSFLECLNHGILHGDVDVNFLNTLEFELRDYIREIQILTNSMEELNLMKLTNQNIEKIEDYANNDQQLSLFREKCEKDRLPSNINNYTLEKILPKTLLLSRKVEEISLKSLKNLLERVVYKGKFGIPIHGIDSKKVENKTNLTIRQERIERKIYELETEANKENLKKLFE